MIDTFIPRLFAFADRRKYEEKGRKNQPKCLSVEKIDVVT